MTVECRVPDKKKRDGQNADTAEPPPTIVHLLPPDLAFPFTAKPGQQTQALPIVLHTRRSSLEPPTKVTAAAIAQRSEQLSRLVSQRPQQVYMSMSTARKLRVPGESQGGPKSRPSR